MSQPFCADCKHLVLMDGHAHCGRVTAHLADEGSTPALVTRWYIPCWDERENKRPSCCGAEGRFFQPKDTQ